MSRIGAFADDDLASWILKSPELGGAIAGFSDAVYAVIAAFLSSDGSRFVAEVESVEL